MVTFHNSDRRLDEFFPFDDPEPRVEYSDNRNEQSISLRLAQGCGTNTSATGIVADVTLNGRTVVHIADWELVMEAAKAFRTLWLGEDFNRQKVQVLLDM